MEKSRGIQLQNESRTSNHGGISIEEIVIVDIGLGGKIVYVRECVRERARRIARMSDLDQCV